MKKTIFSLSVLVFLVLFAFGAVFSAGTGGEKIIALCFDDGPKEDFLKEALPLFDKYAVYATFFPIGCFVKKNEAWVIEIYRRGHHVENHTWGHDFITDVFKAKGVLGVCANLDKASALIKDITGRRPKFFRPRSWVITPEIESIVNSCGYRVVKIGNPDINTMDYDDRAKKHPPEDLIERVRKIIETREKKGITKHVLVFHELKISAEALKVLIPELLGKGYKFVTLEDYFSEAGK